MGSIQTNLQGVMQKAIPRREFLGIAGLAILSIFGMGTIIKLLNGKPSEHHAGLDGYGSTVYGGANNQRKGVGL